MATTTDSQSEDTAPEQTSAQLQVDLKTLRGDLDTLAADVAALGRNQIRRARDGAAELARAGETAVGEMDDTLSTAVRERPLQSLAVAFFAGYVFSAIVR